MRKQGSKRSLVAVRSSAVFLTWCALPSMSLCSPWALVLAHSPLRAPFPLTQAKLLPLHPSLAAGRTLSTFPRAFPSKLDIHEVQNTFWVSARSLHWIES